MSTPIPRNKPFQVYTRLVVFVALLLIWWGAATTTKQAGMVFADWPLSLGTFNPPGWLDYMIPFLEHSHRLLAKLVGFLVLGLFCWVYVRSGRRAFEVVGLVLFLGLILGVFIAAGSERFDLGRKRMFLFTGLALALGPIGWLVWSWRSRGWNLVQKLSALALLMVTTQAIFGGMRVTEISDTFAVVHGCFAQAFFCVLLLIVMVAGTRWSERGFQARAARLRGIRAVGVTLVSLIGLQLVFGAFMRHFHRSGIADDGLIRTQGQWIPEFSEPVIAALFLHKFTALCIFLFVIGMVIRFGIGRGGAERRVFRFLATIFALLCVQIILGLSVIGTEKSFWVTNVHVLNGLCILALSFVFSVHAWRGEAIRESLAPAVGSG
jgi:cytochrome c oxidase assembly protein subunit 15